MHVEPCQGFKILTGFFHKQFFIHLSAKAALKSGQSSAGFAGKDKAGYRSFIPI
jgi:hypothetical protein